MKIISGGRSSKYLARFGIFLIIAALIVGMAGCDGGGGDNNHPSQNLEIYDWYDLDNVRNNLNGNHTLMNNLNYTTPGYTELASPTANGGEGWQPIGTHDDPFTGAFDGQGYEICDLFINRPEENEVALFSITNASGLIKNLGMINVTLTGAYYVGGLVGDNHGTVSDSYSSGNVTGVRYIGGLVGLNGWDGTVSNSYSTGNVSGDRSVGGLVGLNHGTVSNSYSTGNVNGSSSVGGLVGSTHFGSVENSHSMCSVIGVDDVGGLVGENTDPGVIRSCYATGSVIGVGNVGGLVGLNRDTYAESKSIVIGSYSTGNVKGFTKVGGLVGNNYGNSTVSNSYSTGNITGNQYVGGLVGYSDGTVSNSFWNTETSGQAASDGGTGKNTTEMQDITTFLGATWDIIAVAINETNPTYIWNIVNNVTYPFLSWQPVS